MGCIVRLIFSIAMLVVTVAFVVAASALFEQHKVIAAVCVLVSIVTLFKAIRGPQARVKAIRGFRPGRGRVEPDRGADERALQRWRDAESRPVKSPRDPRTKYCLENMGREIKIQYKGQGLQIVPLRVYTKPMFRKTYVDAVSQGEERTYDIDDIVIG